MSKKMASIVIAYGVVVAAIGVVLRQVAPDLSEITFIASLAGGGLSVLWGIWALIGKKQRTWAVLTLVALTLVGLSQAVPAWVRFVSKEPISPAGTVLLTFAMLLTVGMLMYLLHGQRPPEFYLDGAVVQKGSGPRSEGARPERDIGHR